MQDTNMTDHIDPEKEEAEERRRRLEEFIFALVDETEYADFLAGDMTTLTENGKENKRREAVQKLLNKIDGIPDTGDNIDPTIVGAFLENLEQGISEAKKRIADAEKKEKEAADDTAAGISAPDDDAKTEKQLQDNELPESETGMLPEKQSADAEASVQPDETQTERDILAGITDKEFRSLSPAEKAAQLDKLRENVHNDLKKQGKALHDMPKAMRNDNNPDYKTLSENVRNDILLINAIDKRNEPEFRKLFGKQAASLGEIGGDIIDYSKGALPVDDIIRENGLGTVIKSGLQMSMKPSAEQTAPSAEPSKEPAAVTPTARGKAMGRQ